MMDIGDHNSLEQLKILREKINWEVRKERIEFLDQLDPLISDWKGQLPNLRDIFRKKDIDNLLRDCVSSGRVWTDEGPRFIEFVINTGYKDEPEIGEDGKPLLHCTTPVHFAVERNAIRVARRLFEIYNKFEVNYTNKRGFSHFHLACQCNFDDVVKKFLEVGQDPNFLVQETGDSPLHLAVVSVDYVNIRVTEVLLRNGANPNLPNKRGSTPLHIACHAGMSSLLKYFLNIIDEKHLTLQVDVENEFGDTPLHLAIKYDHQHNMKLLLKRGVDPNLANKEGSTPLHVFCQTDIPQLYREDKLFTLFLKMNDDAHQLIQIDARDKLGRTPLQWAVANFWPYKVDVLLDRGADMSLFVFPTEDYFAERYLTMYGFSKLYKLATASRILFVVERLITKGGYKLNQSDALMIMKYFSKLELYEKSSSELVEFLNNKDSVKELKETMVSPNLKELKEVMVSPSLKELKEVMVSPSLKELKETMVNPSLSVYDLIQLRPKEAAKILTYEDYFKFAKSAEWLVGPSHYDCCTLRLCEQVSKGFFQCWALDSFLELTRYRLPVLCCEMVFDNLSNEDLWRIFLAGTGQSP